MALLGKFSFNEPLEFAMLSLNTNVAALYTQRALDQSTAKIASLNKKILGASGDGTLSVAADGTSGSATPTYLTAQIKGVAQALSNTTSSNSLMTQAKNLLTQINTDLTTMKTQAAAYAAGDAGQQATAQAAYNVAQIDINTVLSSAVYNSQNLFNGTGGSGNTGNYTFQVGANKDARISITLPNLSTTGAGALALSNLAITNTAGISAAATSVANNSSDANGMVSRLGFIRSELQSNYDTSTAQRTAILNNESTTANTELAVQIMLKNAAQAILAQANTSAQAVIALIKSAQLTTA